MAIVTWCNQCEGRITIKELIHSEKKYMRPLCRNCQKDRSILKGTRRQQKLCKALRAAGYQAYTEWRHGDKHIDIAIPDAMFHIEVHARQNSNSTEALKHVERTYYYQDSNSTQVLKHVERTYYYFKEGYFTLILSDQLVNNDLNETVRYIADFVKESRDELFILSNLE